MQPISLRLAAATVMLAPGGNKALQMKDWWQVTYEAPLGDTMQERIISRLFC
jgi:hypothetical protein